MKWLTLEYIKAHSRIDFADDDDALELYGNSAEEAVLTIIRRTEANVRDLNNGEVPAKMYQAALMLTELGYTQRSPVAVTNIYAVDYTFDFLIKGLMRLDAATDLQAERNTLLDILQDISTDFRFAFAQLPSPTEEQKTAYYKILGMILGTGDIYQGITNPTSSICKMLREQVAKIKAQCDEFIKSAKSS
jgi:hypothetical protein